MIGHVQNSLALQKETPTLPGVIAFVAAVGQHQSAG
jgi:hypothetical protein